MAHAVRVQPDTSLFGVAAVVDDYRAMAATEVGIPSYASNPDALTGMRAAAFAASGALDDVPRSEDAAVDAEAASSLRAILKGVAPGVNAVLHGGQSHLLTGHSFVAQANDGIGAELGSWIAELAPTHRLRTCSAALRAAPRTAFVRVRGLSGSR